MKNQPTMQARMLHCYRSFHPAAIQAEKIWHIPEDEKIGTPLSGFQTNISLYDVYPEVYKLLARMLNVDGPLYGWYLLASESSAVLR